MKKHPDLVLLAHDVGQFGGQERALEEFAVEVAKAGRQLHIVAFRVSDLVRQHASVTLIPRLPGPFALRFLWLVLASTYILRRFSDAQVVSCGALTLARVDAIWMHLWHREHLSATGWFCAWPGTLHRFAAQSLSRGLAFLVELWALHVAVPRLLIAVSESQARALREAHPKILVVVVPNPVRVSRHEIERRSILKRVVFVGGSWGHKGLTIVAKAASKAAKRRAESLELKVVGPGALSTIRRISKLPRLQVVHVGWTDDVSRQIAGAELFVIASRHETFSMAGHEALALGIPVVSTEVHGLADAVRKSGLGLISQRSVPALEEAIDRLLWKTAPSEKQRQAAAKWMDVEYGEQAVQAARLTLLKILESVVDPQPGVDCED